MATGTLEVSKSSCEELLLVENLKVSFSTNDGILNAVDGVSFSLKRGEVLGLVGESGAGKSVSALAIMGLLPSGVTKVTGSIIFDGKELVGRSERRMRSIRGKRIAMIYQDPLTSLNPVMRVGNQIAEPIMVHFGKNKQVSRAEAVEIMKSVKIPNAEKRASDFPHQFSGGMRQRIVIAMALACQPDLLIADEPTTMLDLITQNEIIETIKALRNKDRSIIFITHDLGVVAGLCDRVAIMYAGKIVEIGGVREIFKSHLHPYTHGLLTSIPRVDTMGGKLSLIPGTPPNMLSPPSGCRFHPRCAYAIQSCSKDDPQLLDYGLMHKAACLRIGEINLGQ
jgi:oligopeptide/dipeptide ABC transporter ATP-binding protein